MSKLPTVLAAMNGLKDTEVLIGIPDRGERDGDSGSGISNAELAYIHSHGSPKMGIPARPFLQPSIEANRDKIAAQQAKVIKAALDGNISLTLINLERVGLMGQNFAKGWFKNAENHWEPNSPATIKQKGSDSPLIDTGQLRNAITYVVRKDA